MRKTIHTRIIKDNEVGDIDIQISRFKDGFTGQKRNGKFLRLRVASFSPLLDEKDSPQKKAYLHLQHHGTEPNKKILKAWAVMNVPIDMRKQGFSLAIGLRSDIVTGGDGTLALTGFTQDILKSGQIMVAVFVNARAPKVFASYSANDSQDVWIRNDPEAVASSSSEIPLQSNTGTDLILRPELETSYVDKGGKYGKTTFTSFRPIPSITVRFGIAITPDPVDGNLGAE